MKKEEMKAAKTDNHDCNVIWKRDKINEGQKLYSIGVETRVIRRRYCGQVEYLVLSTGSSSNQQLIFSNPFFLFLTFSLQFFVGFFFFLQLFSTFFNFLHSLST